MRMVHGARAGSRVLVVGMALAMVAVASSVASAAPSRGAKVDPQISMTDAPDPVTEGGTLTYSITVTNAGRGDATSVSVIDELPSTLTFLTATPAGSCSAAGQRVTCSMGTVGAGSSVSAAIEVRPNAAGSVQNSAKASAAQNDANEADNTATATTTVNARPGPGTDPDAQSLPVGGCTVAGTGYDNNSGKLLPKCSFVYSGAETVTVVAQVTETFAGWSNYWVHGMVGKVNASPLAACGAGGQAVGGQVDYYFGYYWIYAPGITGCVSTAAIANDRSEPSLCVSEPCGGTAQAAPKPGDVLVCDGGGGSLATFSYTITCKG